MTQSKSFDRFSGIVLGLLTGVALGAGTSAAFASDTIHGTCVPYGGMAPQPCQLTHSNGRMLIGGFQAAPILTMENSWKAVDHRGQAYKVLKSDGGSTTFLQPTTGAQFTFHF